MKSRLGIGMLGASATLAISLAGAPAGAQDDLTSLRQQLEAMKARLAEAEADKVARRRAASPPVADAGEKPHSWRLSIPVCIGRPRQAP
jgi:hypothetical protein